MPFVAQQDRTLIAVRTLMLSPVCRSGWCRLPTTLALLPLLEPSTAECTNASLTAPGTGNCILQPLCDPLLLGARRLHVCHHHRLTEPPLECEAMRHVIVGGGVAGVCCAEELCRLCPEDQVTLVSADRVLKVCRRRAGCAALGAAK